MNAWGVIVIAIGGCVMWWSVKHAGSLSLGNILQATDLYGGNVDPLANQHGANPWAPFPDLNNFFVDKPMGL
jgi:hypothetical protein